MSKQSGQVIIDRINKTRRQVLQVELATTMVTLAVCLLTYMLVAAVFDHWLFRNGLPVGLRYTLLIVGGCAALAYFVFRLVPLFRYSVNPAYAADVLEQWHPGMKNRLVNWVFLKREKRNIDAQLERQVIESVGEETAANLGEIPDQLIVDCSVMIRWAITFVVVLALFCVYTIFSPKNALQSSVRAMMPFLDVDVPQSIMVNEVKPGDVTVYQGDTIQVTARVDRQTKLPVHLVYSTNDGRFVDQRVPMSGNGDGYLFECRFPPGKKGFEENLTYHIEVGNSRSKSWTVTVKPSIAVDVKTVEYRFPDYTRLAPQKIDDGGDVRAVEGTEVTITVKSNVSMSRAVLLFDGDANRTMTLDVSPDDKTVATGKFSLGFDSNHPEKPVCTSYTLRCWDDERRGNPMPCQYRVDVVRDVSPVVEWSDKTDHNEPVQISLNQPFNVALTTEDPDFGLQHVQLKGTILRARPDAVVRPGNTLPETNELPLENIELLKKPPRTGKVALKMTLVPSKLNLMPGDRVAYYGEAVDTKQPNANSAVTTQRFFVVAPIDPNLPEKPNVDDQPQEENNNGGDQKNDQQNKDEQSNKNDKDQQGDNDGHDKQNGDKQNGDKKKDDQQQKDGQQQKDDQQQKQDEQQRADQNNTSNKKESPNEQQNGRGDKNGQQNGSDEPQNDGDGQQSKKHDQNVQGQQEDHDQSQGNESGDSQQQEGDGQQPKDGSANQQGQGTQPDQNREQQGQTQRSQSSSANDGVTKREKPIDGTTNPGDVFNEVLDHMHNANQNEPNASAKNRQSNQSNPQSKPNAGNQSDTDNNTDKGNKPDTDNKSDADNKRSNSDNNLSNDSANRPKNDSTNGDKAKDDNTKSDNTQKDDTQKDDKPDDHASKDDVTNPQNDPKAAQPQQKNQQTNQQAGQPSNQQPDKQPNQSPDKSSGQSPENMPDRHDDSQKTDRTDVYTAKEGNDPNAQNIDPETNKKVFQSKEDQGVGSEEATGDGRQLDGNKFEGTQSGHHDNERAVDQNRQPTGRPNPSAQDDPKKAAQNTSQNQSPNNTASNQQSPENELQRNNATANQQGNQQTKQQGNQQSPNAQVPTERQSTEQPPGKQSPDDQTPNAMPQHRPQQNQQPQQQQRDNKAVSGANGGDAQTGDGGGDSVRQQGNRRVDSEAFQPRQDEANIEYTKQATSFAVEYLENELAKERPDQQLLNRLGWDRNDMQKFVERWKQMQRQAATAPHESKDAKQWDDMLKNIGKLTPKSTIRERRSDQFRATTTTTESHRYAPPKGKYEQRTKAYTESMAQ